MQQHSTFICNPHVDCECGCPPCLDGGHAACLGGDEMPCGGCRCESKDGTWCNPYSVEGYCPTEGEGDECEADLSKLIVLMLNGGGFTYALLA